jgi:hypothetical protein
MEEEEEEIRPILRVGQRIMGRTKRLEKAVYPTRCKLSRGMESAKGMESASGSSENKI